MFAAQLDWCTRTHLIGSWILITETEAGNLRTSKLIRYRQPCDPYKRMITDKKFAMERSNSMMSSRSIDNEEMMVIEINFGKNKKDDIVVHFGDNPAVLAEVCTALLTRHRRRDGCCSGLRQEAQAEREGRADHREPHHRHGGGASSSGGRDVPDGRHGCMMHLQSFLQLIDCCLNPHRGAREGEEPFRSGGQSIQPQLAKREECLPRRRRQETEL